MGYQRAVMRGDVPIDGLKRGIIGHNPLPGFILHLHAHHFVDLYRHSALREVIVELANGAGAEPRLFESIWIERGGKGGAA